MHHIVAHDREKERQLDARDSMHRTHSRSASAVSPDDSDKCIYTDKKAPKRTLPQGETVRYLFVDFKAFHYLRQEQQCSLVSEEAVIHGYEAYMVEQWVCERRKVTVITSYTGNQSDTVRVGVLALPRNPSLWTPRTKAYFDELLKGYARAKETELGVLFVTSLSSFPSFLTLVSVPGGDVRKTWEYFDVNENLKRMGCGGRASLAICEPSGTAAAKFKNIYKIHDSVPVTFAAKELVVLVQLSLFYFGVLQPEYCDGLLCNETVEAINTWWDMWGVRKYNTKPKDGVLGPTTVAGLIGFVIGVRNRMAYVLNSKVAKDPFDCEGFVAGLSRFQKHERLIKTRIIDQRTMDRLYLLTNKGSYNSDIIDLFKSSIKEVSGKQHLHMTASETFNLEQLTKSLQGARCKYLWAGKGNQRTVDSSLVSNCVGIPMSSAGHTELAAPRDIRRVIRNPASSTTTSLVSTNNNTAPSGGADTSRRAMFKLRKPRDVVEVPPSRLYRGIRGRLRSTSPNDSVDDDLMARGHSSTPELDLPLDNMLTDRLLPQEYHDDSSDDDDNGRHLGPGRQDSIKTTKTNQSATSFDNSNPALHFRRRSKSVDQFHHELSVPEQLEKHHRSVMRRNSFSLIENFILRQPPEKSFVSEKRIRRSYEKSQLYHFLFKRHVKKMRHVCEQIDQESRLLGKAKMRDDVLFEKLTSYLKNSYREEARLKAALHEVEVMSSRIRYESKMLQSKIQDVEETMDSFVSKVQSLEERVQKVSEARGYGSEGFNVQQCPYQQSGDGQTNIMSPLATHGPPSLKIPTMKVACTEVGKGEETAFLDNQGTSSPKGMKVACTEVGKGHETVFLDGSSSPKGMKVACTEVGKGHETVFLDTGRPSVKIPAMKVACTEVGRGGLASPSSGSGSSTPAQSPLGDIFEDGPTPSSLSAVLWPDSKPGEEGLVQRVFNKLCELAGYETKVVESAPGAEIVE
ncbi:Protein STB2 [Yarrowia sp. C11]|nr:Protein STB2 [Yarrowia sp. E02]KAG5371763.1 Protein STB2 [Yarrowia sp. C11]